MDSQVSTSSAHLTRQQWLTAATTKQWKGSARTCWVCWKSELTAGRKHSVCSLCKSVPYCSKECQVQHWPTHKRTCRVMATYDMSQRQTFSQPELYDALITNIHKWIAEFGVLITPAAVTASGLLPLSPGYNIAKKCLRISLDIPQNYLSATVLKVKDIFTINAWQVTDMDKLEDVAQNGAAEGAIKMQVKRDNGQEKLAAFLFYVVGCQGVETMMTLCIGETEKVRKRQQPVAGTRVWMNLLELAIQDGLDSVQSMFRGPLAGLAGEL